MSGGGGEGKTWIGILVAGVVLCAGGYVLAHGHSGPGWLAPALLALGGLGVVFGSCEAMIKCVEGLGARLRWNEFVAGTIAGLASNIPEVMMLAFVVAKEPRVAFVVVALSLHVGALVLGLYSAVLPRAKGGHARLPEAMVKLSTDLYACGAGFFLVVGLLMMLLRAFDAGDHKGEGLGAADLYVMGIALLAVEVVAVISLIKNFSGAAPADDAAAPADAPPAAPEAAAQPPSWGAIIGFGLLGVATSILGGHAVGDFSDALVNALRGAGYSEMVGAIILSVFAAAGCYVMMGSAHFKGKADIALAAASGQVNQTPFVVMPVTLILMAAFAQTGVIPTLPHGGVLAIDLETTSVMLFGFPVLLTLWKAVQDDGTVNWLETASMVAVFGLIVFLLAVHG